MLVYQATHVPVGEDQKQHLELARDIATKFNADYGVELFTLPEPFIGADAARIMSLRDGLAKMSKSDPSDMSRIHLTDDADLIDAEGAQGEDRSRAFAGHCRATGQSARSPKSGGHICPPCLIRTPDEVLGPVCQPGIWLVQAGTW